MTVLDAARLLCRQRNDRVCSCHGSYLKPLLLTYDSFVKFAPPMAIYYG